MGDPTEPIHDEPQPQSNPLISRLMLVLLGWAIFIGIGASLWTYDLRKGAIIVGCMAIFVTFWWAALATRKK